MILITRLIFVPLAFIISVPIWIIIGIINPQRLGKVLIKTGENIIKENY